MTRHVGSIPAYVRLSNDWNWASRNPLTKPVTTTMADSKEPFPCNIWRRMANSLPPVFTIGGLDFSMTIASAVVLGMVRFAAEQIMVSIFGWPNHSVDTKYAAASISSIFHSMNLVPSLAMCFWSSKHYNPSAKLSDEPPWWQESAMALIQFCTGYMLYDALLNILWMKLTMVGSLDAGDLLFLGHHIVTAVFMLSNRILQAGHQAAMICMFWGELTNPLHNSMFFLDAASKLKCCNGPTTMAALDMVNVAFSAFYVLVRFVIAPFVLTHLLWNLWTSGSRHIPLGFIIFWSVLVLAVQLGSISTIQDCWQVVIEHYYSEPHHGPAVVANHNYEL
jgi:TLC domain